MSPFGRKDGAGRAFLCVIVVKNTVDFSILTNQIYCCIFAKVINSYFRFGGLKRVRVEPRCAERWHGFIYEEMMSNSTLPLALFKFFDTSAS